MVWFAVIIFSAIIAYLLRIFEISNSFNKIGIEITIIDSFRILFLLTKNYFKQSKLLCHENKRSELKTLNSIYWLFFDTLLVSLTTIIKNALQINANNKIAIIPVSNKDNVVQNVDKAIPFMNESMASAA